ncbi:MAG: hypothetical protein DSZ12_00475, partial [Sulfurovum sp.]
MALFRSEKPANFAILTTQNQIVGEPVKYCRQLALGQEKLSAVLINVGQANVNVGTQGTLNLKTMLSLAAEIIGINQQQIAIASTGTIGQQVKIDNFV